LTITTFSVTNERQHKLWDKMKSIMTLLALAAFTTTAFAGSLSDPVIEAPIIIEEASSSSSGTMSVALLALLLALPVLTD
jgi:hypothetical protein